MKVTYTARSYIKHEDDYSYSFTPVQYLAEHIYRLEPDKKIKVKVDYASNDNETLQFTIKGKKALVEKMLFYITNKYATNYAFTKGRWS